MGKLSEVFLHWKMMSPPQRLSGSRRESKSTRIKIPSLSILEWGQLNVGLGNWGRLGISFFGGFLAINMWTSNKICVRDHPHKGTEIDSIDFLTYDYGEFIFSFVPKGKQLVNKPILPLHSHFQWVWQFQNLSPVSKGSSFQGPSYKWVRVGSLKRSPGRRSRGTWVRYLPFGGTGSSFGKAYFL